jgi:hypothetical protein
VVGRIAFAWLGMAVGLLGNPNACSARPLSRRQRGAAVWGAIAMQLLSPREVGG